jgi:predicted ATPase/GAF domain-containing protein/HPt (histidine-containing phosphotransfer) domain-containing protein
MRAPSGYTLGERLYESPTTLVARAVRVADGVEVVLKVPATEHPDAAHVARYHREYAILRRIGGDGVLRAHALERAGNVPVLVVEHVPGARPLADVPRPEPSDAPTVVALFVRLARALGTVHARGVVHKDVAPRNVLVAPDGAITFIDFGLSSLVHADDGPAAGGQGLEGTLAYVSPEQTGRIDRAVDARSDLYSLGATFYEILTGRPPFDGNEGMELVHAHIALRPEPAREREPRVPAPLSAIVAKLLAKDPEERYQSAGGLARDLEECLRWIDGRRAGTPPLGRHDVPSRLHLPRTLYGCDEQRRAIAGAFARAAAGGCEVVWVTGPGGAGKSSLAREIRRPVAEARGYFVAGKHDELKRGIPYSALIEAFRDWMRQILAESEERLQAWRAALREALGANGAVLGALIPEIAVALGPQPEVIALGAIETRARFHETFLAFVRAIATREHPLVVFIDDLQWADAPTIALLERMLVRSGIAHLLIVGAYRDGEVDAAHPLARAQAELTRAAVPSRRVEPSPLARTHVEELLGAALRASRERVAPLAAAVVEKTHGNPFFVHQFVETLHAERILRFDEREACWSWDLDAVRELGATDNVVDLVVARLRALPPATREALELAACAGSAFDLRTLARLVERPARGVARDLWRAVGEGLLVPVGRGHEPLLAPDGDAPDEAAPEVRYRFVHDRVQQAAYTLLDDAARRGAHRRLGRAILAAKGGAPADDALFDVVNHLDRALDLVVDPAERAELASLNERAAARAKASTGFEPAIRYLTVARDLLPENAWASAYDLAFRVHRELFELHYLTGDVVTSDAIFRFAWDRAQTTLDKVALLRIQAGFRTLEHDFPAAIDACRRGLALLGVPLPAAPSKWEVFKLLVRARLALRGRSTDELAAMPDAADPEVALATELLDNVCPPAIQLNRLNLFATSVLTTVILTARRGVTPGGLTAFIAYGSLLAIVFGDDERRRAFGDLGLRLAERYPRHWLAARAPFLYALFTDPWESHVDVSLARLGEAIDRLMQLGDYTIASYAMTLRQANGFLAGRPLSELVEAGDAADAFFRRSRDVGMHFIFAAIVQACRRAVIGTAEASFVDPRFGSEASPRVASPIALTAMTVVKSLFHYFKGDADFEPLDLASVRELARGTIYEPVVDFADSGMRSLSFDVAPPDEQAKTLRVLRRNARRVERWAARCPVNFLQMYLLMAGEIERLSGRPAAAVELFERAIAHSREHRFLHHEALGHELAARACIALGKTAMARAYMADAIYANTRWGATEKLRRLAERYPDLVPQLALPPRGATTSASASSSTSSSGASLDLGTVLAASQAIAQEVTLARLLANLMKIAIENAGAAEGVLLDARTGELRPRAAGRLVEGRLEVRVEGAERASYCASIAQYVARTHETVVLHDAAREGPFVGDPYIAKRAPRSILCVPLLRQGALTAVLWLENDLVAGAFTPARVELLGLLASQIAIAIENATLYSELEARVALRTHELSEANRSLQQLFDHMRQAIVAFGPDGVVAGSSSREAARVFGRRAVEGAHVRALLFPDAPEWSVEASAFDEWLAAAFEAEPDVRDAVCAAAPTEVVLREGTDDEVVLALEFRPIVSDGRMTRAMLLATDETATRRLERRMEASDREQARQKAAMRRILRDGTEPFVAFVRASEERLDRFGAMLAELAGRPARGAEIEHLFQLAHTLKGEARLFDLAGLGAACALVEDQLQTARADARAGARPASSAWVADVAAGVTRARAELASLREALAGASPVGAAILDQVAVRRADLARVEAEAARVGDDGLARAVGALLARPFGESVARLVEATPVWADALGKRARVDVSGREVPVPPALGRCLSGALTHLVRNAIAHGIEAPEDRASAGKDPTGLVTIACAGSPEGPVVTVEDDGRGIDTAALRARAEALGIAAPAGGELDLVFASGLSTAERADDAAGRGVGLAAVREELARAGYAVAVRSRPGRGARFMLRPAMPVTPAGGAS